MAKKKKEYTMINPRFTEEELKKIDEACKKEHILSRAALIRKIVLDNINGGKK